MPSLSRRRATNPEGQMPLVEHLRELRNRLTKAIAALIVGMVLGFVFFEPIFDFLRQPYCVAAGGECPKLYLFGVLESFTFRLKVTFIVGMVVTAPVWTYQLWAFVTPGLHNNERRYMLSFVGLGVPFFLGGVALAYFTISKGLELFLGLLSPGMELNLKAGEYITFLVIMMLVFGISFELPLLVTVLNFAGVLPYEKLRQWRRWIVFGICVFAAVATPSQDPVTMLALAVPMAIFMEVATFIAKIHDRRQAQREGMAAYEQLDDEETSPLDLNDSYQHDDGADRDDSAEPTPRRDDSS